MGGGGGGGIHGIKTGQAGGGGGVGVVVGAPALIEYAPT